MEHTRNGRGVGLVLVDFVVQSSGILPDTIWVPSLEAGLIALGEDDGVVVLASRAAQVVEFGHILVLG